LFEQEDYNEHRYPLHEGAEEEGKEEEVVEEERVAEDPSVWDEAEPSKEEAKNRSGDYVLGDDDDIEIDDEEDAYPEARVLPHEKRGHGSHARRKR
jgi:hypothetical protein